MAVSDIRCLQMELEECRRMLNQIVDGSSWQAAALQKRIMRIADCLVQEWWEVSKVIAEIQDTELRLIFELRWFRGLSWAEVARQLPTSLSPGGARMKYHRYLKQKDIRL